MYQFLHRVLEPAPTSPVDPYRWRRDNRSVSDKVVSGMRLGGGLVAGILVGLMAFSGVSVLPGGDPAFGRCGPVFSWTMLCAASMIMLWTANRWVPWLAGFFCLPALLKALGVILLGPEASRSAAAEAFVGCIVVIALTWRFVGRRPAVTTFLDRLALTFFVLAIIKQMESPYQWPPFPLISGFTALVIAWCAYRWRIAEKQSKHDKVRIAPD